MTECVRSKWCGLTVSVYSQSGVGWLWLSVYGRSGVGWLLACKSKWRGLTVTECVRSKWCGLTVSVYSQNGVVCDWVCMVKVAWADCECVRLKWRGLTVSVPCSDQWRVLCREGLGHPLHLQPGASALRRQRHSADGQRHLTPFPQSLRFLWLHAGLWQRPDSFWGQSAWFAPKVHRNKTLWLSTKQHREDE